MKNIDSKTFSKKIAQLVDKLFIVDKNNNENLESRILTPFSVELYKTKKEETNGYSVKIDDITIVTGFVVEEDQNLVKSSEMKFEFNEINDKIKASYDHLKVHVKEFFGQRKIQFSRKLI
jgi:hypothetical protein